jgi:[ribosomal protein S18]-alanine N-acetyltransferase
VSWSQPKSNLGIGHSELLISESATLLKSKVVVRAVSSFDLDRIAAIEAQAYAFPWSLTNFSDSIAANYDFWVLETSEGLLGYALVMWLPDEAHLLNITVRPDRQGLGVGRRFLNWLLGDVQARGALSLMLEVRPSNPRALALYVSMGFAQIGSRKGYYPSWNNSREDALVLSKPLLA